MNANKNMKLPADCTLMTEEEMMTTNGGSAAETAVKAVRPPSRPLSPWAAPPPCWW